MWCGDGKGDGVQERQHVVSLGWGSCRSRGCGKQVVHTSTRYTGHLIYGESPFLAGGQGGGNSRMPCYGDGWLLMPWLGGVVDGESPFLGRGKGNGWREWPCIVSLGLGSHHASGVVVIRTSRRCNGHLLDGERLQPRVMSLGRVAVGAVSCLVYVTKRRLKNDNVRKRRVNALTLHPSR